MNILLILSVLKKGWVGITHLVEFLWKHKALVAILLLITYVFILRADIDSLKIDKLELIAKHQDYVNSVKEQNLLNEQKRKEQELEVANKQIEIERKYNEKITKLQNDIANANSSNRSLSEQLTKANSRIAKAPVEQVRSYSSTTTELLRDCSNEYTEMAERAEQHRLAETRAVDTYNSLVDTLSKDIKD